MTWSEKALLFTYCNFNVTTSTTAADLLVARVSKKKKYKLRIKTEPFNTRAQHEID